MKALYATYDDTLYKMQEPPLNCFESIEVNDALSSLQYLEKSSEIKINMNLGLIKDDFMTNKEVTEKAINNLKEKKVKSVDSLIPSFEIAVDYILFNNKDGKIYDEGVMIHHNESPSKQNFYRILGVDEEDELHHRFVKKFEENFRLKYIESIPCGIIERKNVDYTFLIKNVIVHQLFEDELFEEVKDDNNLIYHKSSEGVSVTRESYKYHYNKPKDVVVFDAVKEGYVFEPININSKFRNISLTLSFILNNYFVVYDESTITDILEENSKIITDEVEEQEIPTDNTDENTETENSVDDTVVEKDNNQ